VLLILALSALHVAGQQCAPGSSIVPNPNATCNPTQGFYSNLASCTCSGSSTIIPKVSLHVARGIYSLGASDFILSGAETYDLDTDVWLLSGAANNFRAYGASTKLLDGSQLIFGGVTVLNGLLVPTATMERFDPRTNVITPLSPTTGAIPALVSPFALTQPGTGNVLIGNGFVLNSVGGIVLQFAVFRFNITTLTVSRLGSTIVARARSGAVMLPDGSPFIVGGITVSNFSTRSCEIMNPNTNTWTLAANLTVGRSWPSVVILPGGLVVAIGGRGDIGSSVVPLASMEFYVPELNQWFLGRSRLNIPRWGASAAMLPDGRIVIAGGIDNQYVLDSVEVYDSSMNTRGWRFLAPLRYSRAFFSMEVYTATGPLCGSNTFAYLWSSTPGCSGALLFGCTCVYVVCE
jgi:hypothetical protein